VLWYHTPFRVSAEDRDLLRLFTTRDIGSKGGVRKNRAGKGKGKDQQLGGGSEGFGHVLL